jgi:cytochrome c oxidase subunit 2
LKSADVIHSFWVPRVGGKRDLIGGKVNRLSFTVDTPGTYPGQCAEFCGLSHANMRMLLIAEPPEAFDRWIQSRREPPAPSSAADAGRAAFMAGGCVACHTIRGFSAGVVGPDLTHFGSRRMLAAGLYANTPENLTAWIKDPPAMKPGARMPKLPLSDEQISAIVSYLESLK